MRIEALHAPAASDHLRHHPLPIRTDEPKPQQSSSEVAQDHSSAVVVPTGRKTGARERRLAAADTEIEALARDLDKDLVSPELGASVETVQAGITEFDKAHALPAVGVSAARATVVARIASLLVSTVATYADDPARTLKSCEYREVFLGHLHDLAIHEERNLLPAVAALVQAPGGANEEASPDSVFVTDVLHAATEVPATTVTRLRPGIRLAGGFGGVTPPFVKHGKAEARVLRLVAAVSVAAQLAPVLAFLVPKTPKSSVLPPPPFPFLLPGDTASARGTRKVSRHVATWEWILDVSATLCLFRAAHAVLCSTMIFSSPGGLRLLSHPRRIPGLAKAIDPLDNQAEKQWIAFFRQVAVKAAHLAKP